MKLLGLLINELQQEKGFVLWAAMGFWAFGSLSGFHTGIPSWPKSPVCLLGGRDKRGGPILTFPARSNHDRIKQEDLRRLVTYLSTVPRCAGLSPHLSLSCMWAANVSCSAETVWPPGAPVGWCEVVTNMNKCKFEDVVISHWSKHMVCHCSCYGGYHHALCLIQSSRTSII